MELEVDHGETEVAREFKLEAVRLIRDRGVSYARASQDLGVHTSQLRSWVKQFADDPQHAFPGQGQMKPEATGPMVPGAYGMTCWRKGCRVDCIGSSD